MPISPEKMEQQFPNRLLVTLTEATQRIDIVSKCR